MKIMVQFVDWMVDISPETYNICFILERGKKILYVIVLKTIFWRLEASMMWYQELKRKLEGPWFKFDPYDVTPAYITKWSTIKNTR